MLILCLFQYAAHPSQCFVAKNLIWSFIAMSRAREIPSCSLGDRQNEILVSGIRKRERLEGPAQS